MSMKVWCAYRVKDPKDLWPLVHDIRVRASRAVEDKLYSWWEDLAKDVDLDKPLVRALLEKEHGDEARTRGEVAARIIRRGYRMAVTSPYRDLFNLDVSIAVRCLEGNYYLIPYCEGLLRDALDCLKQDPRLEDFHYQNQTDPPDPLPSNWKERERAWNAMCEPGVWLDMLVLVILDWNGWGSVEPRSYDFRRKLDALVEKERTAKAKKTSRRKASGKAKQTKEKQE